MTAACSKPSTLAAMPMLIRAAPRQSIRSLRPRVLIPAITVRTTASTAIGMLIQKIARQVHWVRKPPAIGPMAVSPPLTPKNTANARPRSPIGKAATTTARAAGIIRAAERPCSARNVMIQASAMSPVGVSPHSSEVVANPTMPTSTIVFEPITSASRPPNAKPAARANR